MLATPNEILTVDGVGLRLRDHTLLDDVSFTLNQGEKLVILGVSGAGKSLLLDAIAGNILHTGTASFHPAVPKAQRTFSFDTFAALSLLKVREVLRFLGAAYRMPPNEQLAGRFKLAPLMDKPIRVLSKGERKRVGVYAALFTDPTVAILDEPTDGMDPMMRDAFWDVVSERSGATLLTTHLWDEATRHHDRIALMAGGRLLAPPASARELLSLYPFTGKVVVSMQQAVADHWDTAVVDDRRHVFFASDVQKKTLLGELGPQAAALGYSVLPFDLTDVYRLLANRLASESQP